MKKKKICGSLKQKEEKEKNMYLIENQKQKFLTVKFAVFDY